MRIREYDHSKSPGKKKSPYRCTKNGQNYLVRKTALKLNRDLASKGETMALYTIGKWRCFVILILSRYARGRGVTIAETATDRRRSSAVQRCRYYRIREIKRWIDNGVQVSKVKCCSVMKMLMCRTAGAISKKHTDLPAKRQST